MTEGRGYSGSVRMFSDRYASLIPLSAGTGGSSTSGTGVAVMKGRTGVQVVRGCCVGVRGRIVHHRTAAEARTTKTVLEESAKEDRNRAG